MGDYKIAFGTVTCNPSSADNAASVYGTIDLTNIFTGKNVSYFDIDIDNGTKDFSYNTITQKSIKTDWRNNLCYYVNIVCYEIQDYGVSEYYHHSDSDYGWEFKKLASNLVPKTENMTCTWFAIGK